MKLRHLFVSLLFCSALLGQMPAVWAQRTRITEFVVPTLPQQMEEYLNSATSDKSKEKDNQKVCTAFGQAYTAMPGAMQERLTAISNVVLKLRVRQIPDVQNFITVVTRFWNDPASKASFDQWVAGIEYIQSRNKKVKDFTDYISFTEGFLTDRAFGGSRSATWQAQQGIPFSFQLRGQQIVISFSKPFELYYASDKDQGTIYGTTGEYYYFDNEWHGHGGRLNWDRTGIPTTACWAVLKDYSAVTKFAKFTADSVMFTNTNYFTSPIMGRVEEALSAKMAPEKYSFPKFCSYQKDFRLKNILPGVDYSGSFMMNGAKFVTSDDKHPANLIFYRQGKTFATVKSTHFTITHDRITSPKAAVKLYVADDSIVNDGINVRYLLSDKRLTLLNEKKRNYYSPFLDTYHRLDLYCEQIVWNTKDDKLEMKMLGSMGDQSTATFESNNYYSEGKFRQIQGIDEVNPIVRVYKYMKSRGMAYDFYMDEFAQYLRMDISQAKGMIHLLAGSGLVSFNEDENRIYVNDKLVAYHEAWVKNKENDYDALMLESYTGKNNAELDLSSNDLRMEGVKRFVLSDSQQVSILPRDGQVTVKKDRDIEFSGRVDAGRFIMFVTGATFNYEDFRLDLPHVDSMMFFVTQFDDPKKEHIVYTPIYDLTGNIQIDRNDNHSGLKETEDYPIFSSLEKAFVYYDRKDIHHGAYIRDKFFYTLSPFTIKDMVDFKTDSLRFGGSLTSAGIFPEIKEPLRVQRDYSLGFTYKTAKDGMEAYGGKGRFTNVVDLSYQGLRGAGKLEYLASTQASKSFYFMPDSTVGTTDTFVVREESIFPDIRNGHAFTRWFPQADSMRVQLVRGGRSFKMYRDDAQLAGNVILRPQGAVAEGNVVIGEGTIGSDRFDLQPRVMDAQVSNFVLRSEVYDNIAFTAQNMKCHTDYDKRRSDFVCNEPIGRTELPLLSYAAYVDKFSWEIDKKELDLLNSKSDDSQGLENASIVERLAHGQQPGARFVSTDPRRDSLEFFSCQGSYLYNKGQLSCRKVFLVHSADAVIAPAGDTLHIRASGAIDLMKHSTILANTTNQYHQFYDCDIMLQGARKYDAKGYIDFVADEDGDGKPDDARASRQPIYLTSIAPDQNGRTVGNGVIRDTANFRLNSAFGFEGKVRVEADTQYYYFDGGIKLLHHCVKADKVGALAFATYLNPGEIRIPVPKLPTDYKGNRITASLLYETSNMMPRAAFLTNDRAADNEMMTAYGFLTYDAKAKEYIIASDEKLSNPTEVVEPFLALNIDDCKLRGEGSVDFQVKNIIAKTFCYGMVNMDNNDPTSLHLNSIFGLSFPIDAKVLGAMQQFISEDLRLAPSAADKDVVRRAMMHYLGAEEGASAYTSYVNTNYYEAIPQAFRSTILLEGIDWSYAPGIGYYYDGVAGLAAIGDKQLHLNIRVKAQMYRRGQGTYLVLYLQCASDHWYYFNYEFSSQQMSIQSSVGEWVDMIKAISPDDRKTSGGEGHGDYRYRISTSRTEVPNFLMRLENLATGQDINSGLKSDADVEEGETLEEGEE